MSHQPRKTGRKAFLLPKGCSDLGDALKLKRQRARDRSEARQLSPVRVSDVFTRWTSWAERYATSASADVLDPEFGQYLDLAALLTSREKDELEKLVAEHPLGAKITQQLMKNLPASRPH